MPEIQEVCDAILRSLKTSPRGLTITDIAKKIHKDRNVTAKYLDILKVEGKVETRQVGAAKVYWLSQRVPLSAFLCFTKNMIVILDLRMNIVQVNDQYQKCTDVPKETLIGQNILRAALPVISTPEALEIITSTEKEQIIRDIHFPKGNMDFFYKMEVIPTLFEDGEKGLTIVLEDITEKKRHLKNMEFLARTAEELVDLPPESDIYLYIADRLKDLLPENPRYYINSYDEVKGQFFWRAVEDEKVRLGMTELIGFDPIGMAFPLKEFFYSAPFCEDAFSFKDMRVLHFKPFYEKEEYSMYDVCARLFPREICEMIKTRFNIAKFYLTGLVWQEQLFGLVGIALGREEKLENKEAILSFLRQVSIALARRVTEKQLLRSEQRFLDLVSGLDIAILVLDHQNTITQVNRKFSDEYGYQKDDIQPWNSWLMKAFPDPQYREHVAVLVNGDENRTIDQKVIFSITCSDNSVKPVTIQPVRFSDGTKGVVWHPGSRQERMCKDPIPGNTC